MSKVEEFRKKIEDYESAMMRGLGPAMMAHSNVAAFAYENRVLFIRALWILHLMENPSFALLDEIRSAMTDVSDELWQQSHSESRSVLAAILGSMSTATIEGVL